MKITEISRQTNKWLNQDQSKVERVLMAVILIAMAAIFIGGK